MADEVIEVKPDALPEVTGEQAAAAKPADKKDDSTAEIAALNKTIKDNQAAADKRLADSEESMKFWYDKAEAKATDTPPAKAKKAEPDEDHLAVFDDETKAAVRGFVKQETAGMVRADEVDKRVVSGVRSQLTQDQLVRDYPELGDNKSDFFKKTTEHYQHLDGVAQTDRLRMAVEQTELGLRRSGTWKERETEAERIARIAAQGGAGGGGPDGQAGGDELTDAQSSMAKNMGVSTEAYVKAAKRVAFATRG